MNGRYSVDRYERDNHWRTSSLNTSPQVQSPRVSPPSQRNGTRNEVELLPSTWNVAKYHAHVRQDALRLVGRMPSSMEQEQTAVLVVTDKPIPEQVIAKEDSTYYYFEVTIQRGNTWVGLVPMQELDAPVTLGRYPGDCRGSIGMSSDGRLYISSQEHKGVGMKESTNRFDERDTLGCGLQVGDSSIARVFFTKNGEMILKPSNITQVDTRVDKYFPAVGLAAAGGDIMANFGVSGRPFRWKSSDRDAPFSLSNALSPPSAHAETCIPSPATPVAAAATSPVAVSPASASSTVDLSPARRRTRNKSGNIMEQVPPLPLDEHELDSKMPAVPREYEGRVGAFAVNEPAPDRADAQLMDQQDIDDAIECARYLRVCCDSNNVSFAAELLEICRTKQDTVRKTLEEGMIKFDDPSLEAQLNKLMLLNDELLDAIKFTEEQLGSKRAPGAGFPVPLDPDSPDLSSYDDPEIDSLVSRKDVFSLICMLHAKGDKRLDSALALMRFARDAEQSGSLGSKALRDEINSFGGMHLLLALFRSKGVTRELKVVVALAVAYLLPSFVQSETLPASSIGLKIMVCLRFLFTSKAVSPNGEAISRRDLCRASVMGVYTFWYIVLSPTLRKSEAPLGSSSEGKEPIRQISPRMRKSLDVQHLTGETVLDRKREVLELEELLKLTVSLVVKMTKTGGSPGMTQQVRSSDYEIFRPLDAIVQEMCAIDMARPIAVREGLLKVLVVWMRSQDTEKVRCAALSVNGLTSTLDNYMAGWIHSQIVDEGALLEIAKILICTTVGQDVRLSVAEILCRLCVAPHTKAAVVEAKCIRCLISCLYEFDDSSSQKVAYAAGRALLQVVAGDMTRESVFSSDNFELDEDGSDGEQYSVISDLVEGGAIGQFVTMARSSPRGKLRGMAVEVLRVLSVDSHRIRRMRLRLCEDGAADALGYVINDGVHIMEALGSNHEHTLVKELHQALCAWNNILDQYDNASNISTLSHQPPSSLVKGCIQFTKTGGLGGLLFLSTLPVTSPDQIVLDSINESQLAFEACRSLALLSPLLISRLASAKGQAVWSVVVLKALAQVLSSTVDKHDSALPELVAEMKMDALLGIGALATYEPHKLVIVDKLFPSLFQAKTSRGGEEDDKFYASFDTNQICLSLGFSEDVFAKQIAGSDPKLMGDWFCLQRSLMIQAMARAEVRSILSQVWETPLNDLLAARVLVPSGRGRSSSKEPAGLAANISKASITSPQARIESNGNVLDEVFPALSVNTENLDAHKTVLQQYHDVYEQEGANVQDAVISEITRDWKVDDPESHSLLSGHIYPLNSLSTEKEWMLSHRRFMQETRNTSAGSPDSLMTEHVQNLLDGCIPSRLIQLDFLPIFDLRPESSFDFRSLVMPQRRYFSFRREGQLVSQLCEANAAFGESDANVHWTLGFTNSSFAGEFSETLVQSLYRCPMIRGISFSKNDNWCSVRPKDDQGREKSAVLALVGMLPPSVSSIIYDNTLSGTHDLLEVTAILETMGRLSERSREDGDGKDAAQFGQKKGSFQSFAIRNSPHLGSEAWNKFFDLLGRSPARSSALKSHPLASLRVLDLSGNELGDLSCSIMLEHALDSNSGCCLEQLDLSRNSIRQGEHVARVLRNYVNLRQANQSIGINVSTKGSLKAPLAYLNLGSNGLTEGGLALEVVDLLKHNALTLNSLDLSENGLGSKGFQFTAVLLGSLVENTCLCHLNLSGNVFSSQCIDHLLDGLNSSETGSSLAFLRLQDNRPPLTTSQRNSLNNFEDISRKTVLERYLNGEPEGAMTILPQKQPSKGKRPSLQRSSDVSSVRNPRKGENMITVLFSAPLVFHDVQRKNLHPFAKLDFDTERELLWQCLEEARRDIELFFDNATTNRLLTAKTKRCSCLHYSGHGHPTHLPFEDEKGGPDWVDVCEIKKLVEQNEGAPFKFVFVSACHSLLAGETFASAGVPHVVCCQEDSELKDSAALAFTRHFYFALAVGDTVKASFEQGCNAVRAAPSLRNNAEEEMKKFILLPKDGNHDVPVFNAKSIREWPRTAMGSSRSINTCGSRSSELSVRNMMQEVPSPKPPEFFLGREVDMYHVLNAVITRRLVSVLGAKGVGRSSLLYALCRYINERRSTIMVINRIFFVKVAQNQGPNRFAALLRELLSQQMEATGLNQEGIENMEPESLIPSICKAFRKVKALLVIDKAHILEGSDERQDLVVFLRNLFQDPRTEHVKVLLTGGEPLGIPSLGGVSEFSYTVGPMNFENTVRLFGYLCPHLPTPVDRKKFFKELLIDETQLYLLPTDEGTTERTKYLFSILGDGIPSRIESAAQSTPFSVIKACSIESSRES